MTAEAYSLKARRTTRIPLRVPVQVIVQENFQPKSLDAWTLIVNIHGAKIECKLAMKLHDEVRITVPLTRKTQTGRIVWVSSEPNGNGNFEFAVELHEPGNPWGVSFPPTDWKEKKPADTSAMAPNNTNAVADVQEVTVLPDTASVQTEIIPGAGEASELPITEAISPDALRGAEFGVMEIGLTDVPEILDLSSERASAKVTAEPTTESTLMDLDAKLNDWAIGRPEIIETVSIPETEPSAEVMPELPASSESYANAERAKEIVCDETVPGASSASQGERAPSEIPEIAPAPSPFFAILPPEEPLPTVPARTVVARPAKANDRLSDIFHEMVESALECRLRDLTQQLGARVEAQVSEMESSAIQRVARRMESALEDHFERLDQHTESLLTSRQNEFEQQMAQFAVSQIAEAQERQNELFGGAQQSISASVANMLEHAGSQFESRAQQSVESAQAGLNQAVERVIAGIEQRITQQTRQQADHYLAMNDTQWNATLTSRMESASGQLQQRVNSLLADAARKCDSSLEVHAEQISAKVAERMEQQATQIAAQVRQSFLKHIVTELAGNQQTWMQQARREFDNLLDQRLHHIRQQTAQTWKQMGEALVRESYQIGQPQPQPVLEMPPMAQAPPASAPAEIPAVRATLPTQ